MGGKRNIRCGKNRTSKSGFLFQGLYRNNFKISDSSHYECHTNGNISQASEDPVATVSAATTASPFSATPPPTSSSSSSERNPSLFEKKFRLGKSGEGFQRFE